MVWGPLAVPASPVPSEMLMGLVHEGPDGGLPTGLGARIVRAIEIRDSELAHDGPDDRGGHRTRHAREGIDVDDAVVSMPGVLDDSRDAQAGLRSDVEAEEALFFENLLQISHLVIGRQVHA